jgi:hypothetical protein
MLLLGRSIKSHFASLFIGLLLGAVPALADVPQGKGDWLDYPSQATANINRVLGTSIVTPWDLANFIVNNDHCQWVCYKCAGGNIQSSEFTPQMVQIFHQAGLRVYGWHRVTAMSTPQEQGALARQIMQSTFADGIIIVPSDSKYDQQLFYSKGQSGAAQYFNALTQGATNFSIGYSSESIPNRHGAGGQQMDQYFQARANFWVPRFYWGKSTPAHYNDVLNSIRANWVIPANKNVCMMGQCQSNVSNPGMITRWYNDTMGLQIQNPRLNSYTCFMLEGFSAQDFAEWQAIPGQFLAAPKRKGR